MGTGFGGETVTTQLEDWSARAKSLRERMDARQKLIAKQVGQGQSQRPELERAKLKQERLSYIRALWEIKCLESPSSSAKAKDILDREYREFTKQTEASDQTTGYGGKHYD